MWGRGREGGREGEWEGGGEGGREDESEREGGREGGRDRGREGRRLDRGKPTHEMNFVYNRIGHVDVLHLVFMARSLAGTQ